MGESEKQSQPETAKVHEQKLKYLEFVQAAAFQAVVYFSSFYNVAKDKSGTLKPGLLKVEENVKAFVGPVYGKYRGTPLDLLKLVDQKVDQSVTELNRRVPLAVKQVSAQAVSVAQRAPDIARSVASGLQRSGIVDAAAGLAKSIYSKCEPTAKGLYDRYENVAEQHVVSAWRSLHRLPLFPQVSQVVVPTAAFCSQKYNQAVCYAADKGYKVGFYLPLVPTEKIAKVFQADAVEKEPPVSSGAEADAPSR